MTTGEVEAFRNTVARSLGLVFDDGKSDFLSQVIERRASAGRVPSSIYVTQLQYAPREELRELARELTIGETYFFRHNNQFRAFAEVAVPDAMQRQRDCRVLSAGCSSGEEAYSLAILLRERHVAGSWSVNAIDVNPTALEKATSGRYSEWSLRDTSAELRPRWFHTEGRDLVLDPLIRTSVTFEERNLNVDDAEFWAPGRFNTIFCRNVLMYFDPAAMQRIIERYFNALAPGGFLFLGHAETLRGVSNDFVLHHTHDTFYYQRKDGPSQPKPLERTLLPASMPTVSAGATGNGWITEVQQSSDRIEALNQIDHGDVVSSVVSSDLGAALSLLREERFHQAIERLPTPSDEAPDAMLLRAALLAHGGKLAEAQTVCERLLELDSLSAGAHYVLALCAEQSGDSRASADHDHIAVYLDPGFAMPRLHLGLLARKAGVRETAIRELTHALSLLLRDDATRVLIFGGGFSREGLVSLCKAELLRLERHQ